MTNYIPLSLVKELAFKEGFCNCGAAKCGKTNIDAFRDWLARGYNASMSYLEKYLPIRENPELLLEDNENLLKTDSITNAENNATVTDYDTAISNNENVCYNHKNSFSDDKDTCRRVGKSVESHKTIFCFLMSYNDGDENVFVKKEAYISVNQTEKDDILSSVYPYKIASYAQRKDYHRVIKTKLRNIIAQLKIQFPNLQAKAFVDTAPVAERDWAVKCGLGWKGKNSLLVTKEFGNKVFIGEILADCTSDYATEVKNLCGNCNRCMMSCPNNAILSDGTIDANRCISYQTIENKEDIPSTINLRNYIYGCDICLNACIWNNKARKTEIQDLEVKELVCSMLDKISKHEDFLSEFRKLRKLTPMDRIKYEKLLSTINLLRTQSQN